jgi:hypothetical protein
MDPALILALSLIGADFAQTEYIARHPQQYYELNPILGKHPTQGAVAVYFAGVAAVNVAAEYKLRQPWNHVVIYWTIGSEALVVPRNAHIGIKFNL